MQFDPHFQPVSSRDRKDHKLANVMVIGLVFGLITSACGSGPAKDGTPQPPFNSTVVKVVANTALQPWLTQAIAQFNGEHQQSGGHDVFVEMGYVEAGQAVSDLAKGDTQTALWIPDDNSWTGVLASRGNPGFTSDCVSVATSPLVIAMWRPLAEALGWPARSLGWLDISSLAADPPSWAYYSGGQFGKTLRLSHTHPALSGSGASALLAVVHAAKQSKTITDADVSDPIVKASVASFESSVASFATSTDALGKTMRQRGIGYLGAAAVYESTVVEYGQGDPQIVPVYPFEGTFVATHPACLNGAAAPEARGAAKVFRDALLSEPYQALARNHGLRPVTGAPQFSPSVGADAAQPKIVYAQSGATAIEALQKLWLSARKPVNLVMILDISGSMEGSKIEKMREGAVQFVRQMSDDDHISVIAFSTGANELVHGARVGDSREAIAAQIQDLQAGGDTRLYDTIADGATVISQTASSQRTNVLVVLTDGQDTNSRVHQFSSELIALAAGNDTSVFTIGYGADADTHVLQQIAQGSNGSYFAGNQANIADIYQTMSAAFGGSVGIGR